MPSISSRAQRAIDLMADGWRLEYRHKKRSQWYQLWRGKDEAPETVHAGVVVGMINAGYVVEGPYGEVQSLTITDKGRALATPKAAQ